MPAQAAIRPPPNTTRFIIVFLSFCRKEHKVRKGLATFANFADFA
jgi:hypothetical protein